MAGGADRVQRHPRLVDAIDQVVRELDGVTQLWWFDRMATVCFPSLGRITPAFAQVVKHYGFDR
jgi:hypothetical protein